MPTIQASFDACGYGGHILPCGMVDTAAAVPPSQEPPRSTACAVSWRPEKPSLAT